MEEMMEAMETAESGMTQSGEAQNSETQGGAIQSGEFGNAEMQDRATQSVQAENEETQKALQAWHVRLAQKEDALNALQIRLLEERTELESRERNEKQAIQAQLDGMRSDAEEEINRKREEAQTELEEKRSAFEAQMEEKRSALEEQLEEKRGAFEAQMEEKCSALEEQLKEKLSAFEEKRNALEEQLEERQNSFIQQLKERRSTFEQQLEERRSALEEQLETKQNIFEEQLKERRSAFEEQLEAKQNTFEEQLEEKRNALAEKESELEKREEALEAGQNNLARKERRLEQKEQRIEDEKENLDETVKNRYPDMVNNYEMRINVKEQELDGLCEQLRALTKEQETVKSFLKAYGEDPAVLKQRQIEQSSTIEDLRNELANRSDKSETDRLLEENRKLREKVDQLSGENMELMGLQSDYSVLEAKHKTLELQYGDLRTRYETSKNLLETTQQELMRLSAPEARLADRDERIAAIRKGILKDETDLKGAGLQNEQDEILWLEGIRKKCGDYGIPFQRRILYAFHTALKINEWSTITVLAGVSGTGKSELPRLYASFGGLNFINVAVQPNWDSQESMLGFFNSIDNRFEPEPLLRFLVQCTEDDKYKDYMSIVLLDEMNLAYVEHYFAEFLSKLEARRGMKKQELPQVEVKLGAGVEPYELKLARTILWTGTMNQDETTKSLSDKVLDRGLVINFPRPKTLSSRNSMKIISEQIGDNRPKLSKSTWGKWTTHEIDFSQQQLNEINRYKRIVEDINDRLEKVGRALGHRVWQSIEYYIANYPTVRKAKSEAGEEVTGELKAAMKIAFEDQIVQKIMPKLRGIETRGKGRQSLQEIEDLLEKEGFENLKDDFKMACEQGYGQFMWSSAKYLDGDEESAAKEEAIGPNRDGEDAAKEEAAGLNGDGEDAAKEKAAGLEEPGIPEEHGSEQI